MDWCDGPLILNLEADEGEQESLEAVRHVCEAHHHVGGHLEGTEADEVEYVVHFDTRDSHGP